MKNHFKPQSRHTDLVVQELDGEILIYDLRTSRAFCLNETSALVWQACDGNSSVAEIAGDLTEKLRAPVNEDFVRLALDQLKKENLIEKTGDGGGNFPAHSRREAIRKIGLASLVALPFVSSLVAPTATNAASATCSGNCRCSNSTMTSCNGSTATVRGVSYVNCNTVSGGNSNCNCQGPFGANDSAGTGFKTGSGCSL